MGFEEGDLGEGRGTLMMFWEWKVVLRDLAWV